MTSMKLQHQTPEDPTEARPVTESDGPRMTSRELASLYGLGRDRMEAELDRLGLRGPDHDGASLYSTGEVARRFEMEDLAKVTAAAALADRFANDGLVARAVREAFAELKRKWVGEHGLHEDVVAMTEAVLMKLKKSHGYKRARRAGDAWEELAVIERFEQDLLVSIRERRQPAQAKTEEDSDV